MKRRIWPLALLMLAATACQDLPPDAAPQTSDLTADQLIARYQAARGGEAALRSIQSVKMTGQWRSFQSPPSPVTVMIAPGRFLRRIEAGSGVMSKVVDGPTAWEVVPQMGIIRPEAMAAKDAARFRNFADPQGPLVDFQAKGNKVEVVGKMPWKDSQTYKLKVTFPNRSVNYYYLDAQTFLPVRVLTTLYIPQIDQDFDLEIAYEDFRDVQGVKWPFTEKAIAPKSKVNQTITWDKIEVNPQPLDEAAFRMPQV